MKQMTVRDSFDFFDIVDDFSGEQEFVIDDALLDEIFSNEENECDSSMEYLSEIVEDINQGGLTFYQEYMTLLDSFAEHYDNIQLQYPGVYSKVKDDDERTEKLMKLAIRDCPTELLGKMVTANIYDKTYCFNTFLEQWYFFNSFKKNDKEENRLSDKIFNLGTKFNQLLNFAEDTLSERQRLEKLGKIVKIKG